MESQTTKEDYKKIVDKGKRWLMEYLIEISEGGFSDPLSRKRLLKVIGDEYRRLMKEDEVFYRKVEHFCSNRHFKKEKADFCREIITQMVTSGNIHREFKDRYPSYNITRNGRPI